MGRFRYIILPCRTGIDGDHDRSCCYYHVWNHLLRIRRFGSSQEPIQLPFDKPMNWLRRFVPEAKLGATFFGEMRPRYRTAILEFVVLIQNQS